MSSGLDTAFVEMIEHAEFDWPERLAGAKVRIGSAEIGAIGGALVGLAVLASRALWLTMRDQSRR